MNTPDTTGASQTDHRNVASVADRAPRAIDYSLKRWEALTRYLDDGDAPIDNNWA